MTDQEEKSTAVSNNEDSKAQGENAAAIQMQAPQEKEPKKTGGRSVSKKSSVKTSKTRRGTKLKFVDKVKLAGTGLLVGLILGVVGTLFLQNYNPPDSEPHVDVSIVFERIQAEDELVCASQVYNITDNAKSVNSFFELFDIPFTENSFWYRYVGTIKAGVNLKTAEYSTSGNVITIEMDQPYIISNTPDMEKSGVMEERNNILNPIHVQDVDAFQRQCVEQSEEEILQGGIMEESRQNAEQNLRDMFNAALGDAFVVEFQWREQ